MLAVDHVTIAFLFFLLLVALLLTSFDHDQVTLASVAA